MRNDGLKNLLVVGTNTHACKKNTKKETEEKFKNNMRNHFNKLLK